MKIKTLHGGQKDHVKNHVQHYICAEKNRIYRPASCITGQCSLMVNFKLKAKIKINVFVEGEVIKIM